MTEMTAAHIATSLNGYGDWLTSEEFVVEGYRHGSGICSIGLIPEGSEGRQVHRGQLVPGPWGWCNMAPSVIDNHGGTAAERARLRTRVHLGQPLIIDGLPGVWMLRLPNQRALEGEAPKLCPYMTDETVEALRLALKDMPGGEHRDEVAKLARQQELDVQYRQDGETREQANARVQEENRRFAARSTR